MLPTFPRFKIRQPLIIAIFTAVWHRRLIDDWSGRPMQVRFVTGFRSCIYDKPSSGQRVRATFLGWP